MRTQVAIIGAAPSGLLLGHIRNLREVSPTDTDAVLRQSLFKRVNASVTDRSVQKLIRRCGPGRNESTTGDKAT